MRSTPFTTQIAILMAGGALTAEVDCEAAAE